MKIWHISDTHGYHGLLNIPKDVDMLIHSGDVGNSKIPVISNNECRDAIAWLESLNIKHKVLIAGNHDIAFERGMITKHELASMGITYLENSHVIVEGLKIWGSPITPTFGEGWAFNKARDKTHNVWSTIPEDVNIIITHGPPKGILDHSYSPQGNVYERCGCQSLKRRVLDIQPELMCFGHIHNCEDIINAGTLDLSGYKTMFSNGSVVTDGKFGKLSSQGNIFNI